MDLDFQDMRPDVFVALGDMLGLIWSAELTFSQQYAVGNWLILVGQTLLTYNAQQQYFQNGPGLPYNPANKNIDNPFCKNGPETTTCMDGFASGEHPSNKEKSTVPLSYKIMGEMKNDLEQLRRRVKTLEEIIEQLKE